ncbi:hypothetical protein ACFSMW_05315 [Virgibacillus halophilus]|uniref:hypothetical protein n=1 Tax=Tigheibacillus halophilus TaxID=361280 RepID=UPI0036384EFD
MRMEVFSIIYSVYLSYKKGWCLCKVMDKIDQLDYAETVDKIIELNNFANNFWSNSIGWAPIEAANLLSKSRLDWQVSLSYSLKRWDISPQHGARDGDLILAWVNLGALVEGTLKLFLSVYFNDYSEDEDSIKNNKGLVEPDSIKFDRLRQFFNKKIWESIETEEFDAWVLKIQQRRNIIHAFKNKDIGDFSEFVSDTNKYLAFLMYHLDRLPYPDCPYGTKHRL